MSDYSDHQGQDLPNLHLPGWEIETPEAISSYEPHLLDVIVCAKQFWSDSVLAQPPFVVLPHEMLKLLHSASPQHAMPRNKMSDTQLKNYRKRPARQRRCRGGCRPRGGPWAHGI